MDGYKVEEAAAKLDVSVYTIRNYIKRGILEAVRYGREYRIKRESLDYVLVHGTHSKEEN